MGISCSSSSNKIVKSILRLPNITIEETLTKLLALFDEKYNNQVELNRIFEILATQISEEKPTTEHSQVRNNLENIKNNFGRRESKDYLKNLLKEYQVKNILRDLDHPNQTSEKTLAMLIELFDIKCRDTFHLNKAFELLKSQIREEKPIENFLRVIIELDHIKSTFEENSSKDHLKNLLKKIQIFNVSKIDEILKSSKTQADREIESIRDKDVVLFLGHTGSGKSTSFLYLYGCQMNRNINGSYSAVNISRFPELSNILMNERIDKSGTTFTAVSYTHLTLPTKRIV